MGFWRNAEVRRALLWHLTAAGILTAAAFALGGRKAGWLVLAAGLVMTCISMLTTWLRYRRIARLAGEIDTLLHTGCEIGFAGQTEGELAVLETEIRKMTLRLREQSERLTVEKQYLADSLADVSHQLRTPLTSMHLLVSLLQEPGVSAERRSTLLRELHGLLSRIDWLVTALLKLSKLDADVVNMRQDPVELQKLLHDACEPLQIAAELREQTLSVKAQGSFTGDAEWTGEAIGNIVKNCMEHTPAGGRITIDAQENPLYSEILIEDTGAGIGREDLPHIFERFYKGAHSSESSYGIGLALARTIITRQGGTVKAENVPDGGARFTIRFYKGAV